MYKRFSRFGKQENEKICGLRIYLTERALERQDDNPSQRDRQGKPPVPGEWNEGRSPKRPRGINRFPEYTRFLRSRKGLG